MRETADDTFVFLEGVDTPRPESTTARTGDGLRIDLDEYFRTARLNRAFEGQVTAEFQAALVQHHRTLELSDCDFYHKIRLPDGSVVSGEWDLHGHEAAYTGDYPFAGKRVLEFGPESGGITAYLAGCGAEVTIFDRPFGAGPELVPYQGLDLSEHRQSWAHACRRLRNGWWYTRRALGFRAAAVYADIYDPPKDLGRFDVAFFGSVLLHLQNPFLALQRAAAITDEAIVVTEVLGIEGHLPVSEETQRATPVMLFNPTPPPVGLVHWWVLSPGAVVQMLRVLGFTETTVTTHAPAAMRPSPTMFTVVGRRPASPTREAGSAGDGSELPLPPPHLRHMVAGTDEPSVFLDLGRRGFDALISSLHAAGVEPSALGTVLDFGCGVGRVLRYWHRLEVEMYGMDINLELIDWARDNLPFARFGTNPLQGPLTYADGAFGFVYALSVFTHLPERMQLYWLAELLRVLRPGGFLYFTTHGNWYRDRFTPEQCTEFDRGRPVVIEEERAGSNFCAAYHPESYVRRRIAAHPELRLVTFARQGAAGNPKQDSWLVQKLPPGTHVSPGR